MSQCRDCNQEIEWSRVDDGRGGKAWRSFEFDGKTEHWTVCRAPKAREIRIRRGAEPGIYPLSPSALDDYRDCPRFYLWRNWARLKALGRISDELLAEFPDGPPQLPEIPAGLLGRTLHLHAAARLKGEALPAPAVPIEFAKDWAIMLGTFERQMDEGQWDGEDASIEDRRTYTWQDGSVAVELVVVLDYWRYLSKGYVVCTDWKSGWEIEGERALKKDAQALTNSMVLMRDFPRINTVRFQQVHFRHGGEVVGVEFRERDIEQFEEVLQAEVSALIRDTDYLPNPFCRVCPPGAHPRVSYPVTTEDGETRFKTPETPDEALTLAKYTWAAERLARAGKELLRHYTAEHGPVARFGHHEHTSRRLSGVRRALDILDRHSLDPDEYLNFDGQKLRSILESRKKWVSLAKDLDPLLYEITRTEFGWQSGEPELESEPASEVPEQAVAAALPVQQTLV